MKQILELSKIYISYLLNKKSFLYSLMAIIIFSLFIIPSADSNYTTFSIGKYTGTPNCYWVSNLGAVFTNLIVSIVAFFFIEGTYEVEKRNIGSLIRVTPSSNFVLLFHKWIAYLFIFLGFVLVITTSLFIINYKNFNFIEFSQPFLYYCAPFAFLLSTIILFFDVFVNPRGLKITLFLILILFSCSQFNKNLDFLGFNEFLKNAKTTFSEKINKKNDFVSFGYVKKSQKLTYLDFYKPFELNNVYKIMLIPVAVFLIYLFSFSFRRFKQTTIYSKKIVEKTKQINSQFQKPKKIELIQNCEIQKSFASVLRSFFILFKSTFSSKQILLLLALWVLSVFLNYQIKAGFVIPLLFLISFDKINNFINIGNKKHFNFTFNTSVYSENEQSKAKIVILFLYFLSCSLPLFVLNSMDNIVMIMINLLVLSIVSILFSSVFKSVKIVEIGYILIFSSCISGHPIIDIFQTT
jgi:hypothetical protein